MTLFEILSKNERLLVLSDDEEGLIYTWNQSLTLQAWRNGFEGAWEEVEVCTLMNRPENFEAAKQAAIRWMFGFMVG